MSALPIAAVQPQSFALSTANLPISGKIRGGIKVPTKAAAANPKVKSLYEQGVAEGKSFDDIAKMIEDATGLRNALTPRNIKFWVAWERDFQGNPDGFRRLLELHSVDRGDGRKRLWDIPVVLPSDIPEINLPNQLQCYTRSGLKYWSVTHPDGTRDCMTHKVVAVNAGTQRAIRTFGPRAHVQRPENKGECIPEQCPEYQNKTCNYSGRLRFMVPGVPGILELPFTSTYGVVGMLDVMNTARNMGRGRIPKLVDGKPVFLLTKLEREVAMLENGQPKRVKQFIPTLVPQIDYVAMLMQHELTPKLSDVTHQAANVLTGQYSHVVQDQPVPIGAEEPESALPMSGTGPSAAIQGLNDLGRRAWEVFLCGLAEFGVAPEDAEEWVGQTYGTITNALVVDKLMPAIEDGAGGIAASIHSMVGVAV